MSGYHLHSFGCRASSADGDAIAAALEREGSFPSASEQEASVIVINTCSVTAQAERSARAMIRRIRRQNPAARILVTGCYAQRAPQELAALPGVTAVLGNSHKSGVAPVALAALHHAAGLTAPTAFVPVQQLLASSAPTFHSPFPGFAAEHQLPSNPAGTTLPLPDFGSQLLSPASGARTRPILKVQDGCGNRCSFCVIPETRGPSHSVPLADALAAARLFAEHGGQELVLSGINLGRWGRELRPAYTLPDLVRALLEETSLPRLRLSSIEPMDWTPALFTLLARYGQAGGVDEHPRLAPHVHLPLQSGADAVLRRMHRRYRPWHYAHKVQALRALLPHAAIGADVMVGFPGETDELFEESFRFIEAQPFTYLHLFPFSPRPRTPAERFHQATPVHGRLVQQRMLRLQGLIGARQQLFNRSFLGHTLSAVTLRNGTALSFNFLPIAVPDSLAPNRLLSLQIASISREGILQGVP